jgi:D-glycero-alpha-D-manno-heptose 1-phosphate guanylyltransferase
VIFKFNKVIKSVNTISRGGRNPSPNSPQPVVSFARSTHYLQGPESHHRLYQDPDVHGRRRCITHAPFEIFAQAQSKRHLTAKAFYTFHFMTLPETTAVILAGGLGTRLRSVVADRPKILAPISGKPFLSYLLDQLSEIRIRYAVLCTGYLGDMVQVSFGDNYNNLKLTYSKEAVPLGTGGAIKLAEGLFKSDHILVMNGDSYCTADLNKFWKWHVKKESNATLLLTHVPDTGRYGQVKTTQKGALKCFVEKGDEHEPGWINAGIYLLNRVFISSIPSGRSVSLEKEIFPEWIAHDIYGYQSKGSFLDIGVPEEYKTAVAFFKFRNHISPKT